MGRVTSRDGTVIAFDEQGTGPALILVDGAMCSRSFGPSAKLAERLRAQFTVVCYDRRGRGESGDTQPYAPRREIEDLAAVIDAVGGNAFVAGLSSGAALALEAAASGLPIARVAAYEPPYIAAQGDTSHLGHERALRELIDAGRRADAVKYFMRMVGAPGFAIVLMQLMPHVWPKLKAVAHTLPYDMAIMNGFTVPTARMAEIRVPALLMDGGKTQPRLQRAVDEIARALPGATRRTLPGQTHNVSAAVLAAELVAFFRPAEAPVAALA